MPSNHSLSKGTQGLICNKLHTVGLKAKFLAMLLQPQAYPAQEWYLLAAAPVERGKGAGTPNATQVPLPGDT